MSASSGATITNTIAITIKEREVSALVADKDNPRLSRSLNTMWYRVVMISIVLAINVHGISPQNRASAGQGDGAAPYCFVQLPN
jgi:hypothetical protein